MQETALCFIDIPNSCRLHKLRAGAVWLRGDFHNTIRAGYRPAFTTDIAFISF
jgi:hypothetical protein